jgi:DNA-binding NarL/FixJ family response regulator
VDVTEAYRLFLVAQAVFVRQLAADVLEDEDLFTVAGQCTTGAQALALVPHAGVDLLVVGRSVPDMRGPDLMRRLLPQKREMRAVMVSSDCPLLLLEEVLDAGGVGVATGSTDMAGLTDSLLRAARGETVAPAEVLRDLLRRERDGGPLAPGSVAPGDAARVALKATLLTCSAGR